jgi:hypothetical protein
LLDFSVLLYLLSLLSRFPRLSSRPWSTSSTRSASGGARHTLPPADRGAAAGAHTQTHAPPTSHPPLPPCPAFTTDGSSIQVFVRELCPRLQL